MPPDRLQPKSGASISGFSLIELLVVFALIASVAAMLAPGLGLAREKARRVQCVNNLRQVGLAINVYADENAGRMPPFFGGTITINGNGNGIHYKIKTSGKWSIDANFGPLNSTAVLVCPSDRNPASVSTTNANNVAITVKSSYTYNYALWLNMLKLDQVPQSKTMLVVDGDPNYDLQTGNWYAGINTSPSRAGNDVDKFNSNIVARRHTGRFNAIYLDGHAEWLANLPYGSILDGYQ